MFIKRTIGLFLNPVREWESIRDSSQTTAGILFGHAAILGIIPPISAYFGTTKVGWTIGYLDPVRLTEASAGSMSIIYYFVIIGSILTLGKMIQWMNVTYGANKPLAKCMALATYPATPLLLVGIVQFYPVLWLNYLIGLPALAYSIYLLYCGTSIVMEIPSERAFLFSSAVLAVCLISLVGVLAATTVLWGFGITPKFTIH